MFCRSLFVVLFIVFYVSLPFTSYYTFTIFKRFPLEYFVIDTFGFIKLFCSLDDTDFMCKTLYCVQWLFSGENIFFK
jgi:hypothetical protein